MKVQTPQIAWHNRDRVSSVSIQPFAYPTPTKEGGTRIATGGDDTHVVVSDMYTVNKISLFRNFAEILEI